MAATVSLPLEEPRDGIFIPTSALVQTETGRGYVFVIEEGRARRKEAIFDKQQGSEIEVLSGLQPGELVVARGVERVRDGSRVLAVE
jgi:membrane fusion protein (multidrug efflux system)